MLSEMQVYGPKVAHPDLASLVTRNIFFRLFIFARLNQGINDPMYFAEIVLFRVKVSFKLMKE